MIRRAVLMFAPCLVALGGCGPMTRPLPERLDDGQQQQIDDAWDRALTPVGQHDRQVWLDVMVGTRAYEHGVDSLTLRSEKAWSGGRVVMEVHFDRTRPDDDRFEVTVSDAAGAVLRRERYGRTEVDQAIADLFPHLPPRGNDPDSPEVAARRAATEARWKRIEAVFPTPDRDGKPAR